MVMQEIERVTRDKKDYYSFDLIPEEPNIGARKIGFLIKENGLLIRFRLYENCKAPVNFNPEWRELHVELREDYPELYGGATMWLSKDQFEKLLDHVVEFIKEKQRN